MANATEETLRQFAGTATADTALILVDASTLPAAGANLVGVGTKTVPSGKTRALFFISYVTGTGGSASGGARVTVLVGTPAQDTDVYPITLAPATSTTSILVKNAGSFFLFQIPPGIDHLSLSIAEEGDTAHPGEQVAALVSFS